MQMNEPLVGTERIIMEKEITNNKSGIITAHLEMEQDVLDQLVSQKKLLNFFMIEAGNLNPEKEQYELLILGDAYHFFTAKYNIVQFKPSWLQRMKRGLGGRKSSMVLNLMANSSDSLRYLYVTLASRLEAGVIYKNVKNRNVSRLKDPGDIKCLRTLLKRSVNQPAYSISMLCPFTLRLMDYPSKGLHCNHSAFFCMKNYIDFNLRIEDRSLKWYCPCCKQKLYYNELFFDDEFMEKIMKYGKVIKSHQEENETAGESNDKSRDSQQRAEFNFSRFDRIYIKGGGLYSRDELEMRFPEMTGNRTGKVPSSEFSSPLKPVSECDLSGEEGLDMIKVKKDKDKIMMEEELIEISDTKNQSETSPISAVIEKSYKSNTLPYPTTLSKSLIVEEIMLDPVHHTPQSENKGVERNESKDSSRGREKLKDNRELVIDEEGGFEFKIKLSSKTLRGGITESSKSQRSLIEVFEDPRMVVNQIMAELETGVGKNLGVELMEHPDRIDLIVDYIYMLSSKMMESELSIKSAFGMVWKSAILLSRHNISEKGGQPDDVRSNFYFNAGRVLCCLNMMYLGGDRKSNTRLIMNVVIHTGVVVGKSLSSISKDLFSQLSSLAYFLIGWTSNEMINPEKDSYSLDHFSEKLGELAAWFFEGLFEDNNKIDENDSNQKTEYSIIATNLLRSLLGLLAAILTFWTSPASKKLEDHIYQRMLSKAEGLFSVSPSTVRPNPFE